VDDTKIATGAGISQTKIAESGVFGATGSLNGDMQAIDTKFSNLGTPVENEIYELTADTTSIELANLAISGSTRVFVNGLRQMLGTGGTNPTGDYDEGVSANNKTVINFHYTVKAGSVVVVDYRY